MSNVIKLPITVLDTFTSAIDIGDSLFGDSQAPVNISEIEWVSPTTVGHTAIVTDGSGNTIFEKTCSVAKDGGSSGRMLVRGVKVGSSGVGSGKIVIRFE